MFDSMPSRAVCCGLLVGGLITVTTCGREAGSGLQSDYVPPPGDGWETRTPAEMGMDAATLQRAVDYTIAHETTQIPDDPGVYLEDRFAGLADQDIVGPTAPRGGVNGIVIKGGYIVAEWGDTDREDMTFSVTKSYLSTVADSPGTTV